MPRTTKGMGCLVVFGAIFIMAGLVPGAIALSSLHDWLRAAEWEPLAATVLETGLERGDDTFRVTARYRYSRDGRDYEGTRVSLHSGSDNIGDFHQATFARLERHRGSGEPLTVYVNPDNPADAVIVRDMRWGLFGFMMIFPLAFGGAGSGIIIAGILGGRREREARQLRDTYPEQPWRWHPEWKDGVVRADTRKGLWFAGFFALVWNLISLPLPFLLWAEVFDNRNYPALVGLLFPVVGIGLILWTATLFLRHRRYSRSILTLDTFPGIPGGQLAGMLHVPAALPAGSVLDVTLSCVRRRVSGSGKNRSTREDILWQDQQRLSLQHHHLLDGTRVHLAFPIPLDQPPTDDSDPRDSTLWRIHLNADVPGVDFDTTLEVPVFSTGEPPVAMDNSAVASAAAEPADWRRTGAITRYGPDGQEFYFPPARHKAMASMLSLITLIFGGATAFLWHEGETFMGIVFGLFALLLAWFALTRWAIRSRIIPSSGGLRLQRGITGLRRWREHLPGEIADIDVRAGTTFGTNRYYDLVAITRDGTSFKLADTLPGHRDADALADMIAGELGIRRNTPEDADESRQRRNSRR